MILLLALVVAAVGAGALPWPSARRPVLIISLAAAATVAFLVPRDGSIVGSDALARLVIVVAGVLGLSVGAFSVTQFAGERRGRRLVPLSIAVVVLAVASAMARSWLVLTVAWVATSAATWWLLRVATPSDPTAHRRAGWALLIGDGPLVLATGVVVALHGPLALGGRDALTGPPALLLGGAATLAAVARAGLLGRPSWVSETVAAPTSVSATLHAGVVNGGAVLLVRVASLAPLATVWRLALAAVTVTTLLRLAPAISRRADLKGQLALSTVAQMSFMLLAIALGWPVLALAHLAGHSLYKAHRFISSGGAIEDRAAARRRASRGTAPTPARRLAGLVVLTLVGLALLHGANAETATLTGVLTVATGAVWWSHTRHPLGHAVPLILALLAVVAGYPLLVAELSRVLAGALGRPAGHAPWWLLPGLLVVLARRSGHRARLAVVAPASGATSPLTEYAAS